jgi:WD40 repeat protein
MTTRSLSAQGIRAALSSDGRRLALGQEDGAISVVQFSKPEQRRTFPVIPDGEEVAGIRFVPGSRLVVIVGPDEFTALVDTDTGRIVRRFDYGRSRPDAASPSLSGSIARSRTCS